MLQLSKTIAALCAGCFCTWTIQQIPALEETLLPQTHSIPDHISPVSAAADVLPSETLPTPAETAPAISVPPTEIRISQTETVPTATAVSASVCMTNSHAYHNHDFFACTVIASGV